MVERKLSQNCRDNIRIDRSAILTSFVPHLHQSLIGQTLLSTHRIEHALELRHAISACDYTSNTVQLLLCDKIAGFSAGSKHCAHVWHGLEAYWLVYHNYMNALAMEGLQIITFLAYQSLTLPPSMA